MKVILNNRIKNEFVMIFIGSRHQTSIMLKVWAMKQLKMFSAVFLLWYNMWRFKKKLFGQLQVELLEDQKSLSAAYFDGFWYFN